LLSLSSPAPLIFGFVSLFAFIGLTWLAVHWYGPLALHEGLLYHFGRVDHRHNFSMHWYWIYLARAAAVAHDDGAALFLSLAGRLLFLPQLVLLLYSSLVIAPQNLSLALFVQTFLFVAHNKVITGQYFTWYLCLLPLCSACMRLTRRVQAAIGCLLLSLILWWTSAYCLEMQGMAVHRHVWLASVLFFGAQVNLLSALLHSTRHTPPRTNIKVE
jgi:phosphatidylinositol glycan class M